jgi:hypothetical protein
MTNFSYFGTGTVDGKFAQVEIDHKKVSNEQLSTSNAYLMKIKNLKVTSIDDTTRALRSVMGGGQCLAEVVLDGLFQNYSTRSQITLADVIVNGYSLTPELEFIVNDPFKEFFVTGIIPNGYDMVNHYLTLSFQLTFEPLD